MMESPEAETETTETAGTGSPPHSSVKCVDQRQYYQRQHQPSQEQESLTSP